MSKSGFEWSVFKGSQAEPVLTTEPIPNAPGPYKSEKVVLVSCPQVRATVVDAHCLIAMADALRAAADYLEDTTA